MLINFTNGDGERAIKEAADNSWDLAIVDPPYFSGPERRKYYGAGIGTRGVKRQAYTQISKWTPPEPWFFEELLRVSRNQIIWGCNYYDFKFGPGRIIWDKCNQGTTFSDCEIAYCSLHDSVRLFRYMWNGMMQGKSAIQGHIMQGDKSKNQKRIHQTEKPVDLYKWLLWTYANEGDKILDTHGGSMSIGLACIDLGYSLDAWEIEPAIFEKAERRMKAYSQSNIFISAK